MYVSVIILAAGKSKRFKYPIKKQFIKINKLSILEHSLKKFQDCKKIKEIILTLPKNDINSFNNLKIKFKKVVKIVKGGKTRTESVKNALSEVAKKTDFVLIHDAVRPFVSIGLINRIIDNLKFYKAVIPVVPLKDTIKEVKNNKVLKTLDRRKLFIVQTPQGFHKKIILKSFENLKSFNFTDDASIVESKGIKVHTIKGEETNIKITTKTDITFAKALLKDETTN